MLLLATIEWSTGWWKLHICDFPELYERPGSLLPYLSSMVYILLLLLQLLYISLTLLGVKRK